MQIKLKIKGNNHSFKSVNQCKMKKSNNKSNNNQKQKKCLSSFPLQSPQQEKHPFSPSSKNPNLNSAYGQSPAMK